MSANSQRAEQLLSGTWFIVQTSLPMWRTRQQPSVTYAPLPDGRILDTVQFWQRGRSQAIVGVDRTLSDGSLEWRGLSPLTRWVTSHWHVLQVGEGWAITLFSRTPFTPAGLDVYSRTPSLTPKQAREVNVALLEHPDSRTFLPHLFPTLPLDPALY